MPDPSSLLLVTHVLLREGACGLEIDAQTADGVAQWSRHFDRVTYCGVAARAAAASQSWVATDALGDRCRFVALPHAYRPLPMARHYRRTRALLRREIAAHAHLCFTIGGLVGDWPALAGVEAIRQRRAYAAWIDRVEPSVIRNRIADAPLAKRLAAAAMLPLGEAYTRHLLRHSEVALLQGRDTYDHYERWASDPHVTYDTHTHAAHRIAPADLAAKQARVRSGAPLEIVYAGRADPMKGPLDWIAVLERLRAAQVPFHATWIGDGPDLPAMRARAAASNLADHVDLPGYEGDRDRLLARLRAADLLLFCHRTPESARCLIEALVCGCPIVGFETAYPRGLVGTHGGGAFTRMGDIAALAARLIELDRERPALATLIADAAASGGLYDEDTVYAHRAALMRRA